MSGERLEMSSEAQNNFSYSVICSHSLFCYDNDKDVKTRVFFAACYTHFPINCEQNNMASKIAKTLKCITNYSLDW